MSVEIYMTSHNIIFLSLDSLILTLLTIIIESISSLIVLIASHVHFKVL